MKTVLLIAASDANLLAKLETSHRPAKLHRFVYMGYTSASGTGYKCYSMPLDSKEKGPSIGMHIHSSLCIFIPCVYVSGPNAGFSKGFYIIEMSACRVMHLVCVRACLSV